MPSPSDVLIVGAGPGGLAAAMLLASAGLDVVVLERDDDVGGRSRAVLADGFRFPRGATFLTDPYAISRLFAACERDLLDAVAIEPLDPLYRVDFGDGTHLHAWRDVERTIAEVAALNPDDAPRVRAFLDDNARKYAALAPMMRTPFASWRDLLRPELLTDAPLLRPWRSVERDLRGHFRDPRIQLAFSFQSKYLGMSPRDCPSLFTVLGWLEHARGIWSPRGGIGALTAAMADAARAAGATILTGTPVQTLIADGRRVTGVDDRRARAVVFGADFAGAASLIPERLRRRWTDRRLARARHSTSALVLRLGVRGAPDLPRHTMRLGADYHAGLAAIGRGELPDDLSLYVHTGDDTCAPPGCTALYALTPAPRDDGRDWTPVRARMLEALATLTPLDVVAEHATTPADWRRSGCYRGATFGLAHTLSQLLHRRPNNRFAGVDGLYLVGGSTHPGCGLPAICAGAELTARLLLADLGHDPAPLRARLDATPAEAWYRAWYHPARCPDAPSSSAAASAD